ncbi:MAG: holo-ACP synthase [Bacilli bacterium]|nr:holo-ACP synthase [Bacilli bacterium]
MIIGIGTDFINLSQLSTIDFTKEDSFLKRTYTTKERNQANLREERKIYYYLTRFAGKEAVYKAISCYLNDFKPNEIEIIDDDFGKPYVYLLGNTKQEFERSVKGQYQIHISLSYERNCAISFCVVETFL